MALALFHREFWGASVAAPVVSPPASAGASGAPPRRHRWLSATPVRWCMAARMEAQAAPGRSDGRAVHQSVRRARGAAAGPGATCRGRAVVIADDVQDVLALAWSAGYFDS